MQGALLRSGNSQSYTALGEVGQPVYKAALQLREAIRRNNPQLIDHLAIPKTNEVGDQIDWYSGILGDVIPWMSATEAERASAQKQFEVFKTAIEELSERFLSANSASIPSDKAVFGKLLKQVINFPDENFIYLVNGKPVLTFWGFEHPNDRRIEPLHCLQPPNAQVSSNEIAVQTPSRQPPLLRPQGIPENRVDSIQGHSTRWWRSWWWLLPLVLLLSMLLFGLRTCAYSSGLPTITGPKGVEVQSLPSVSRGNGLQLNSQVDSPVEAADNLTGTPSEPIQQPSAELTSMPTEITNEKTPSEPLATKEAPTLTAPPVSTLPPQQDEEAVETQSSPGQAEENSAEFLNGNWQAGAGIQDRRTGKPLRLEYHINNGKGAVTVHRPDGVACTGPVVAAFNNGSLSIDSQGQAACTDGGSYQMPQIHCAKVAESIADCTGSYGNERFPMSMRRASE